MEAKKLTVLQGGLGGDASYIDDVFGRNGYLAKRVKGYQPRPGQIKLAKAIDHAIREGQHVVGEGPTGTGKSLAYSVPAAYHAVHNHKRICIVTANKTLQSQIVNKDLKDLKEAVPWNFKFAVRKGLNSYLCQRDFEKETYKKLDVSEMDRMDDVMVEDTVEWAENTSTGDYEDSPGPNKKIWRGFSTNREDCAGPKCGWIESCFVAQAKEKSLAADIVVTNYHLFFLHLQHVASGRPGTILPLFDIAIMDEAHNAANIAREFFGTDVGFMSIYQCVTNMHMLTVRSMAVRGKVLKERVMDEARRFFAILSTRAKEDKRIFEKEGDCPSRRLEEMLMECHDLYKEVSGACRPQMGLFGGAAMEEDSKSYQGLAGKCLKVAEKLGEFRVLGDDGKVYFIEGMPGDGKMKPGKGGFVKLKSKAVHVGGYLNNVLFEPTATVVSTSATLAVKGGKSDFDYYRREMGIGKSDRVTELTVPSPFNWPKQSLMVIPETMPEYKYGDANWDKEVCKHFAKVVRATRGRTMGLFTSFRVLDLVKEYLRSSSLPYKVLAQGEATNRELQDQFRKDVSSVLLGTTSFSEGVDIQGEACTCVILDKIPFITQNDPVMKRLEKVEGNTFTKYQVPEAIISFKQRVGRLIRSVDDVGIVVVLDTRLGPGGKPYGKRFLNSIPPIRVTGNISDITPFLKRVGAL